MKNIVCVTSTISVGCTFLDWSIHFLSGKNAFYSVSDQSWIPLSMDPVTKINAHGHKKNHPTGYTQGIECLTQLRSVSNLELLSFYPYELPTFEAAELLGILPLNQLDDKIYKDILDAQRNDYSKLINHCAEQGLKIVYLDINEQNVLYGRTMRSISRLFLSKDPAADVTDYQTHLDRLFFQASIDKWNDEGLTNTWDRRERLALSCRPFDFLKYKDPGFDYTKPHIRIDARSLWYNGHTALRKIMDFLDLSIVDARWEAWTNVYAKWQEQQLEILEFEFNYEYIVNAIINNWYYDIGNLTFDEEVIIQHLLIYQHGLNLKTWQLEKFPNNTQDLHLLLEPNIHTIETIY